MINIVIQSTTVWLRIIFQFVFNPLSASLTKWPNTLKQFVGKLLTNYLSLFAYFAGFVLKGLNDIAASDLSIQFKLRKRGFLLKTLSRTITFQIYSRSVKRISSVLKIFIYYRNCYVQTCSCKKTQKECQKTNYKMS